MQLVSAATEEGGCGRESCGVVRVWSHSRQCATSHANTSITVAFCPPAHTTTAATTTATVGPISYCVQEQQNIVELRFGKYTGLAKDPGVRCSNPCGRELRYVSTKKVAIDLPLSKIVDANANPVMVSGE